MNPPQEKQSLKESRATGHDGRTAARPKMSSSKFLERYNTHAAMLMRVVARAGVARGNVEDVCQDVWREVFEKAETLFSGDEQDFRSWLCQIGRNRATDWLRKKDNRLGSLETGWERPDDKTQDILNLQVHQEEHAALTGCVNQLKEPRCTIVRERLSGTEIVDIAEKVQLTREQVDRQFHAAKEQLRACVQEKLKDVSSKGAL